MPDRVGVLVFLIPCVQFVKIVLVGSLTGSDLLLLGLFVYLAFRKEIKIKTPAGKWFVILGLLWLASQCVTDIVRHSAFADYARGWSNIGITLIGFAVLYTLMYQQPRRLLLFGWGLVVGNVLLFFINPTPAMLGDESNAWKFAFAGSATLGVFLIASSKRCRGPWPVILSVIIGMINMVEGARSVGGVCLAVALYLVITRLSRAKGEEVSRFKTKTIVVLAASILIGVSAVLWSYGYAADAGVLGEEARHKYEEQSSGKYGVILGGRPELFATGPAIYDSPILGHGSWAREPLYIIEEHEALDLLGYEGSRFIDPEQIKEGLIPTHSYLFGAWVDSGILGAVFWGWVFVLTARGLMRVYPATAVLLPLMSYTAFSLLWEILFSPYGTQERLTFPYTLVIMMTCMGVMPAKAVRAVATSARRISRSRPKRIA
jgi:hypothetical protein